MSQIPKHTLGPRAIHDMKICLLWKAGIVTCVKSKNKNMVWPLTNSIENDLRETDRNPPLCDYYPEITASVKVQQPDCSAKN